MTTAFLADRAIRRPERLATALGGLGLAAAGVGLAATGVAGWPDWPTAVGTAVTAVSWLVAGWLVAGRRPGLPFGWLLLGGGLCLGLSVGATGYATAAVLRGGRGAAWAGWFGLLVFPPHLGCQEAIYLLFPSGRLPSPRWRRFVVAIVLVNAAMMLTFASGGGFLADGGPLAGVRSPVPAVPGFSESLPLIALAQNVLNLTGMWLIGRRWRRAEGTERRVLGTVFVLGLVDAAVGVLLIAPIGGWVYVLAVPSTMCLTGAIAWGLLRHSLWDIRVVVSRTLVWLVLTGLLVLVLAAGVAGVGLMAGGAGGRTLGLVAAAAIATTAVVPLERRLRRAVDRRLFGERLQPYTVLSTLGADLETAGDPADALQRLTVAIRSLLKVSYAAVELVDRNGASTSAASSGVPPDRVLRVPVRHQGQDMGALVVGQDEGDRPFTASDRRLLDDLARQAGAAAATVALTTALQQSRYRLVSAREEERRRLRKELHDGVASALTAIGLKVDSAASITARDPDRAATILEGVQSDVAATLGEVRRVVTDLRPPALDDLGLGGALAQLRSRFDSPALRVEFACVGDPPSGLPAAVELAVYRIASEAVQNVVRHAQATSCRLELTATAARVVLRVEDDGNGLIPSSGHRGGGGGLGLAGMAERVDELGGSLEVGARTDGRPGSVVTASLPVGAGR